MNTIALICARSGSKGLPGKNIKVLAGKPLVAWAIGHALEVKRIDQVIVSTDSNEIANIARKYGAQVPFIRPADLADDNCPEWLVWRHALEHLYATNGEYPKALVIVPATSPLRSPIDIEKCLDEYENSDADIVITVTRSHRSPYFNMVKQNLDGAMELVIPLEVSVSRRQDAPEVYDMTTVAYVVNPEFAMTHNSIFEGHVRGITIPQERALDIDTLLDFKIAEFFMEQRGD